MYACSAIDGFTSDTLTPELRMGCPSSACLVQASMASMTSISLASGKEIMTRLQSL